MEIGRNDVATLTRIVVPTTARPETFQRLDLVRLGNGQKIIVTGYHPNRPKNCYSGVLEKGQGKEYVFGARHRPVKIGTVQEGHPALLNNQTRIEQRYGVGAGQTQQPPAQPPVDNGSRAVILRLLEAVEGNDLDRAKFLATVLRDAGFKS
jgi:hypothetical protein